jgi:peptidoglycan-associated lipoprotein
LISGTPTAAETATLTVKATDASTPTATITGPVTLTVLPIPPLSLTGSLPNAILNLPYTQTLTATGGVTPYSYKVTAGSLPAGLSLSTTGVINGTPTVPGASSFTVTVTDTETTPQTASLPTTSQCEARFRVSSRTSAALATGGSASNQVSEDAKKDAVFHANVQDALFDYDSAAIREDAQTAINHAAQYLKDNPSIRVLVGGYADERGSAEYNLALGEERANAARNALIAAGVDAERIQIISYGKEAQVCTADNEKCWQQNRRAAFSLHP